MHTHPKKAANIGVRNVRELRRVRFPTNVQNALPCQKRLTTDAEMSSLGKDSCLLLELH